ncbi:tetratricopeptide repeat protein [Synoicihabitans lomoniglobus]|uniref:Tetratricopeptide repeat protein n=1 Tax=Synoicihabitans lomoniglobus TaxID=2909285 RepID=A0AAF0CIF2_9BACT|nr:hypothetical protein [Opitutaceae bacterium LMO-M01]WED65327.1 hypothetical protein PXH66_00505 [Opitutaceae bacterium LMO-M01]
MSNLLRTAFFLGTMLLGISGVRAADWIKLEAEDVTVMSDGRRSSVVEFAKDYVAFRTAAHEFFGRPGMARPKSLIILHTRGRDFRDYVATSQKNRDLFSFSTEVDGRAVSAMTRSSNWEHTFRLATEFDTIWLMRRYGWALPTWMSQGSGAVMSTAYVDRDAKVVVGKSTTLAHKWKSGHMIPWERFFNIGRGSAEYKGDKNQGAFHAQAWGLMHWLLLRDDAGPQRFQALAEELKERSWLEAVVEVGGVPIDDLNKTLRRHVRSRLPTRSFPFDAEAVERSFVITALDRAELLAAQSDVAAASGEASRADLLYFEAAGLAPNLPAVLEAGARRLRRLGEWDSAIDKYKAAIAAGTTNANAYVEVAEWRLNRSSSQMGGGIPAVMEPATAEVRRALELSPGLGEAYRLLGRLAYLAPEPDPTVLAELSQRVGPDFWGIQARFYRGLLLNRLGRTQAAVLEMEIVLSQAEAGSQTAENAQSQLQRIQLAPLRADVDQAYQDGDYEKAWALIDAWEASPANRPEHAAEILTMRHRINDRKKVVEQRALDREMRELNRLLKAKQYRYAQEKARGLLQTEHSETLQLAFTRLANQVDAIATMQLVRATNADGQWAETIELAETYLEQAPPDQKYRDQIEAGLAEARQNLANAPTSN